MKALVITLGVIFALLTVGLWTGWGLGGWFLSRDTQAVLYRAQVAANAADMKAYVTQLQKNMEERGMTKGFTALVWKTPEKDMELIYKTVVRANERLTAVQGLPQMETTYQVALDDLRGTLRELQLNTAGWFWTRNWWWILGSFVSAIISVIFFFIGAVL